MRGVIRNMTKGRIEQSGLDYAARYVLSEWNFTAT